MKLWEESLCLHNDHDDKMELCSYDQSTATNHYSIISKFILSSNLLLMVIHVTLLTDKDVMVEL